MVDQPERNVENNMDDQPERHVDIVMVYQPDTSYFRDVESLVHVDDKSQTYVDVDTQSEMLNMGYAWGVTCETVWYSVVAVMTYEIIMNNIV